MVQYVFLDPRKEAFEVMWTLEISFALYTVSVVLSNAVVTDSLFPLHVLLGLVRTCNVTAYRNTVS